MKKLLIDDTDPADELPFEVKHNVIPLNISKGSPESLSFLKGIYKCQND